MASARFTPNTGLAAALAASPAMQRLAQGKANRVRDIATEIAPVGSGPAHDQRVREGRDYKSNLAADTVMVDGAWAGRVLAKAAHSEVLEIGSSTMEPRAPLHRALEAAGGSE